MTKATDESDNPLTYEDLHHLAHKLGCTIDSLLVLSKDSDPFFAGMPVRKRVGEWFAGLWGRFQLRGGIHLRGIHYVIVSQKQPVLKPKTGEPYINTFENWKYLGRASNAARWLGLVDGNDFVDRRADEP